MITQIADISSFETLLQTATPVINNRVVVDNGFRDTLLQMAQQARERAVQLAKEAAWAGRKQYK